LERLRARVPVEAGGLHLDRWRVSGTNISARLLGEDLRAELMLGPEEPITVVSPHRIESIDGYEVTSTRRRGSYEFAAWNQDKVLYSVWLHCDGRRGCRRAARVLPDVVSALIAWAPETDDEMRHAISAVEEYLSRKPK